jgi:hypothetical protein
MNLGPRSRIPLPWIACFLLIACRWIGAIVLPVYDDAFITFRFARNLAAGHGFVYQPGQWVLGTTAPLFGLLCSLPHLFHLPMPGTVIAGNMLVDALILIVTWNLLDESVRSGAFVLFAFLFATSPILTRVCVGGMEADLFLLTSLTALFLTRRGRPVAGIALAALACFLRPEGVLLLGLLFVMLVLGPSRGRLPSALLVALVIVAPPVVLLTRLYGSPLPHSMQAKAILPHLRPDAWSVFKMFLAYDPLAWACLGLGVWGAWKSARDPRFRGQLLLGVWALGYVAAYALARPKIWSWYGEPVYYVEALFAAIGSLILLESLARSRERGQTLIVRWAPALLALPCLVWLATWKVEGPSGVTTNVFRPLASWCRSQPDLSHATIAAVDIGAVGYYSNATIYDLAGLVWPGAIEAHSLDEVIAGKRPDYLFLNANENTRESLARWRGDYSPTLRFSISGAKDLTLADVPPKDTWVQDYVLCARREPASAARSLPQKKTPAGSAPPENLEALSLSRSATSEPPR